MQRLVDAQPEKAVREAASELLQMIEPCFISKHESVVQLLCGVLVKLYTAFRVSQHQDQHAQVRCSTGTGNRICI